MTSRTSARRQTPSPWVVYDVDFKTGKVRWQQRRPRRRCPRRRKHQKNSYASETPVTDGERVYAYFGNVGLFAFDMNGKLVWSQKPMAPVKTRTGFGARRRRPSSTRIASSIVNDNDEQSYIAAYDTRTGNGAVARRPRREQQLVDAVRLAERAAHRDRHGRHRQGPLLRSRRQAAVGARRDVDRSPSRRRSPRTGCSTSRPATWPTRCGRSTPSGRARPATSRSSRSETSNDVHRLVAADARAVQPVAAGLRRLLLHAARPRLPDLPRREDRQGDLRPRSGSRRTPPASPRRRGPTTARSSRSARTATPSSSGRAGIQDARQELAGRDERWRRRRSPTAACIIRTASKLYRIRQSK